METAATMGVSREELRHGAERQARPEGVRGYALAAVSGAAIGVAGSGVQALVGYAIDRFFLPRGEDNNIAPRFVRRVFGMMGKRRNDTRDWALGTVFHLGYGAVWGAALNVARAGTRAPASALAVPLGAALYALAFSRFGVGTLTGTEDHPKRRPERKQASLVAVDLAYTVPTAIMVDLLARWGRRRRSR